MGLVMWLWICLLLVKVEEGWWLLMIMGLLSEEVVMVEAMHWMEFESCLQMAGDGYGYSGC